MQTEGKRQLIKHKITWCFIILVAGFMGMRFKMACVLSLGCSKWLFGVGRKAFQGEGGRQQGPRWQLKPKGEDAGLPQTPALPPPGWTTPCRPTSHCAAACLLPRGRHLAHLEQEGAQPHYETQLNCHFCLINGSFSSGGLVLSCQQLLL